MRYLSLGLILLTTATTTTFALPPHFVYLHDVDPTIVQEMRYHSTHNFIGRIIHGYETSECILTDAAAKALANVQKALHAYSLSLKVYDCYRPTQAVDDFMTWSKNPHDNRMKREFYPNIDKANVFSLGYVAEKSGHSRGSTIDLTIIPEGAAPSVPFKLGEPLQPCTASYPTRYQDSSIDMGTGYDCMDELASPAHPSMTPIAKQNRQHLQTIMQRYGFQQYDKEWWHFTLQNEPFPTTYFNFPVK